MRKTSHTRFGFTGVRVSQVSTPVLDRDSSADLVCEYHSDRWSVLTLQGFETIWVRGGAALMRCVPDHIPSVE